MNRNSLILSKNRFFLVAIALIGWSTITSQSQLTDTSKNEKVNATNHQSILKNPFEFSEFETAQRIFSEQKKPAKWVKYKNELGAFSVNLPTDPKDISRDTPNPLDEAGDPYQVNMYSSIDEKNQSFYIVRYNDMPNGFYLNDREAGFNSIQENLLEKAVMVSEPKIINLGDIEGREVELLINGEYHAFLKMYIRGNRIYVLMAQKLNKTEKVSLKSEFFNSFKFEDYAPIIPKIFRPKSGAFEMNFFEDVKNTLDTVGYENSRIKQSTNYYSTNSSSGGLYQLNQGILQDYVQIKDLNEFYDEHMALYMVWNDSIINKEEIRIDGKQGLKILMENQESKIIEKYQIWLDNDQLNVMTGYLSDEERNSPIPDMVFGSFKQNTSNANKYDISSSKSNLLFKDLLSKDSLIFLRATGAFDYYKFEKTDLPKLYQALKETYKDSTYTAAIKEVIIGLFPTIHDEHTIDNLKTLYNTTFKDDQEMKSAILSTLPNIKEDKALETYKDLIQKSPPSSSKNYMWELLSPFRDSLQFTVENFKLLTGLMEHQDYRYSILDISTDIITEHPEQKRLVLDEKESLLKYARNDLGLYLETKNDSLGDSYQYSGLVYAYLTFFNDTRLNTELTDQFTSKIIETETSEWYITQALTARIRSQQSLDTSLINRLVDSLDYRFSIMKAYHEMDQFKEIPNKYKEAESFAELSLYAYVSDDDTLESSQIMGEFTKNNQLYYAYKVKYLEEEAILTSYIATVGPIIEVASMDKLQLYDIYTEWEQLDIANWKSQAENLIPSETLEED